MNAILNQLDLHRGATGDVIDAMLRDNGTLLPDDYLDFLRQSNGAIGHGPDLFVILEPAEKIRETTLGYASDCPWLIVVGGDGCGNIIGIDARSRDPKEMDYVVLDPVWLDLDSESCQYRSKKFIGVLEYLAKR